MMSLEGQTVLVTGASGSIGQAIVRAFAGAGGRVAIHYHANAAAAEQLKNELPGEGHVLVPGNIAHPADVHRMVSEAVAAWGRLDILVNNAAVYIDHAVDEVSYSDWHNTFEQVISVNLLGAANACYCAARQMMTQGGGRIINVGSRGAYRGEPRSTSYGASKAALHALSQSLAQELAPHHIYVTAVAPGFVEGGMAIDSLSGPRGDAIRSQSPLGRVARPEEVAHTVLFLASPGSEFLTGAVVDINGASYLR
jgi:NAD(P)-dependent dehydrogenase (short-subunit alcohol dehydrogenase family)